MDEADTNRWRGKSQDKVLNLYFHEIRNNVLSMTGYLNVIKSMKLYEEQTQHIIDDALNCALSAKDIVDTVYQYMEEQM